MQVEEKTKNLWRRPGADLTIYYTATTWLHLKSYALVHFRAMMAEIFPSLESELLQFVSFYERADAFFTLHALVRLSKHVLTAQDTGSFLAISFGTVLVQIKRNFDRFMQAQQRSLVRQDDESRLVWKVILLYYYPVTTGGSQAPSQKQVRHSPVCVQPGRLYRHHRGDLPRVRTKVRLGKVVHDPHQRVCTSCSQGVQVKYEISDKK